MMRQEVKKPEVFRLKMYSEWTTKVTAGGETFYQHEFNVVIFISDASRETTPLGKKDDIDSESQGASIYTAVNRRCMDELND